MRTLALSLATVIVCFATGCGGGGGSDDKSDSGSPATAGDLSGRTFVSTSVEGQDFVDDPHVVMTFGPKTLEVNAGCNQSGGRFEVNGGVLKMKHAMSTLIGCPEGLQNLDQWLNDLLADGIDAEISGDDLRLERGDANLEFTDQAVASNQ